MSERMTPEIVRARVAGIRAVAPKDDEAAHGAEDALYAALLRAIAEGRCDDVAQCAREALKTEEIDFARWCA